MAPPLTDTRVLDLSTGAVGGVATMVLADFGAEVVKVEPAGGDPWRSLAAAPMWLRGKRSLELDIVAERSRLEELIREADVVVSTDSPAQARARPAGVRRHPRAERSRGLLLDHRLRLDGSVRGVSRLRGAGRGQVGPDDVLRRSAAARGSGLRRRTRRRARRVAGARCRASSPH